jgi:spermidine/putrescine transport system substrate-binding protein
MVMDWYYDPVYAAMLTEFNAYVSPVPAAGEIVQADADAAGEDDFTYESYLTDREILTTIATSPFVFPTSDLESKLYNYRVLEGEEIEVWNDLFNPIFIS